MKAVNLETFYAIQKHSGGPFQIFSSEEDAKKLLKAWDEELKLAAEEENPPQGMYQSRITPDFDGGGAVEYYVNPAYCPICLTFRARTQERSEWEGTSGFKKIRWGNPATERPRI